MAKPYEHLEWAEKTEAFANSLDRSDNVEVNWAITALFYAAVHYVDAYLVSRGNRQLDHQGRDYEIRQNNDFLKPIWKDYKRLKDMSREARYELAPYGEREFIRASSLLNTIKRHISQKLQSR